MHYIIGCFVVYRLSIRVLIYILCMYYPLYDISIALAYLTQTRYLQHTQTA